MRFASPLDDGAVTGPWLVIEVCGRCKRQHRLTVVAGAPANVSADPWPLDPAVLALAAVSANHAHAMACGWQVVGPLTEARPALLCPDCAAAVAPRRDPHARGVPLVVCDRCGEAWSAEHACPVPS